MVTNRIERFFVCLKTKDPPTQVEQRMVGIIAWENAQGWRKRHPEIPPSTDIVLVEEDRTDGCYIYQYSISCLYVVVSTA